MPGRVLARQADSLQDISSPTTKMGVYKLTFPGDQRSPTTAKTTPFRPSNLGRGFVPSARVQPLSKTSEESSELEHFTSVAMATDTISEDDTTSIFTSSTRTSNTISDDDISLADFAMRSTSADFAPARHSTACCTDLALRRELRKKFHVEPALDEAPDTLRDSFAMGHSFRRELEKEDRVESLALWEETETPASNSSRTITKDMPHSWHGDTASSMSSRNKGLEAIFRKPKKASASFFNGFFSGLTFSTSRRSRKS
ncbi:hypothetical protein M758_1G250300 [Ceratodon purpureus]|nr:hypothetical protein M758_1G250300 [Ceratodon purpureus]